jgi:phosphoglycolate phosphatase-like HAD superfamily hydrolase
VTVRRIDHVIFDYDGTCTDVPAVTENFFRSYLTSLNQRFLGQSAIDAAAWRGFLSRVRAASPDAGWTIKTTPAAPGAADPYIQAFEAARLVGRQTGKGDEIPREVFDEADGANPAPLRPELADILRFVHDRGARVTFISNSQQAKIQPRLEPLFGGALPDWLKIQPGGSKYTIGEPLIGATLPSPAFLARFLSLPGAVAPRGLGRPAYLRRPGYVTAISQALGGDVDALARTVFCGDIWEMDLAMPFHLGANIHLVTRATPFETYPYERDEITRAGDRGRTSDDLNGLRDWF